MPKENVIDMNAGQDMLPGAGEVAEPTNDSLSDAIAGGAPTGSHFDELQQLNRETEDAQFNQNGAYYSILNARLVETVPARGTLNDLSVSSDTTAADVDIGANDDLNTIIDKVQSGKASRHGANQAPSPK